MSRELSRFRSLLASLVVEDREGKYKSGFVRRVLKASSRKPDRTFKDAKSFLSDLDKV